MTLKQKIKILYKDLSTKQRGEQTIIVCDDGYLKDLIYKAHDGVMPNDWIFDKVHSILCGLHDADFQALEDIEDSRHEFVDSLVDIYTNDLLEWAKRFRHFVDDAKDQGLVASSANIEQQLMAGQFVQIDQIFNTIINGIDEIDSDDLCDSIKSTNQAANA